MTCSSPASAPPNVVAAGARSVKLTVSVSTPKLPTTAVLPRAALPPLTSWITVPSETVSAIATVGAELVLESVRVSVSLAKVVVDQTALVIAPLPSRQTCKLLSGSALSTLAPVSAGASVVESKMITT